MNRARLKRYRNYSLVSLFLIALVAGSNLRGQNVNTLNPASLGTMRASSNGVTFRFDGFTESKYNILLAATEIGRLDSVDVKIGERVEKDQVIAKLEDQMQREAVSTATLRAQMRGELEAAKAETNLMKTRVDNLRTLADKEMARPDELKRAIADWEIATARELAAEDQIKLRELELERYKLQLQRRSIRSPMSGVVAEIFHSPGEYITPADPAVIRLLVIDEIYGVFNVPVEEMGSMAVGQKASVELLSLRKGRTGTITSISPSIDGESGTVRVKVLLNNSDGRLRPGDRCQMGTLSNQSARTYPTRRLLSPTLSVGTRPTNGGTTETR